MYVNNSVFAWAILWYNITAVLWYNYSRIILQPHTMTQLQTYYNTTTAILRYNYSRTEHHNMAVIQKPYIRTTVQVLLCYDIITLTLFWCVLYNVIQIFKRTENLLFHYSCVTHEIWEMNHSNYHFKTQNLNHICDLICKNSPVTQIEFSDFNKP